MGLLDDAIREHLDLKRRRGADPAEIERDEREALGPVRRNRESGADEDAELAAAVVDDPALGSARDEPDGGTAIDLAEESFGEQEPDGAFVAGALYAEDEEPVEDEPGFAEDDDDPFAEQEDPHRTQLMSTVDVPVPGEATSAYDVQESFAEDDPFAEDEPFAEEKPAAAEPAPTGGEEDEDVLEETPEFLQDTPDHDRLWFEQRPPRDFDFDG